MDLMRSHRLHPKSSRYITNFTPERARDMSQPQMKQKQTDAEVRCCYRRRYAGESLEIGKIQSVRQARHVY